MRTTRSTAISYGPVKKRTDPSIIRTPRGLFRLSWEFLHVISEGPNTRLHRQQDKTGAITGRNRQVREQGSRRSALKLVQPRTAGAKKTSLDNHLLTSLNRIKKRRPDAIRQSSQIPFEKPSNIHPRPCGAAAPMDVVLCLNL
jgi:hypothetical protein